jgi:hypothetical protein
MKYSKKTKRLIVDDVSDASDQVYETLAQQHGPNRESEIREGNHKVTDLDEMNSDMIHMIEAGLCTCNNFFYHIIF